MKAAQDMTPADLAGSLVAHRNDRMGARIISILNAVRVSRDYGVPYYVGWTTGGRTYEECRDPTMIFDADFVREKFFDYPLLGEIFADLVDFTTIAGAGHTTPKKFKAMLQQGEKFLSGAAMGVVVFPWEDPEVITARLTTCVDELIFSPPVREMIDEITAVFAGKSLTAYHIRRGDIIHDDIASNKLWPNKYIPREFYEVHLANTLKDPNAEILVFSDTPEEVTRLKAFSNRVRSFDDLLTDRDLTCGARDFLELYAMSRCKRIYGPPSSAFSQTAVTIGDGTLQAVQDALSTEDQATAMDLMTDRLEAKSDLFLNFGDVGQCLHFLIDHQLKKGDAPRAKRIIRDYMEDGLDKSFAYQLLCELSVADNDLAYCERVFEMAYARPVYVEDSIAVVNGYAALSNLVKGDDAAAMRHIHAAMSVRPLDPLVHGALNLAMTSGALTPETFYPYDPAMTRTRQQTFSPNRANMEKLSEIRPHNVTPGSRVSSQVWDIAIRDWQRHVGRKLSRGFANKSKIEKTMSMLDRAYSGQAGTPEMLSARGVLLLALDDDTSSLEAQSAAIAAYPDMPLYHKRVSDVLHKLGEVDLGMYHLEKATEIAGDHPCYLADLCHRSSKARKREQTSLLVDKLAGIDHNYAEIHMMVADMLRRQDDRVEEAIATLDKGLELVHGNGRLMNAKARLLMKLERIEEAEQLYDQMVSWGQGNVRSHAEIYRLFDERNMTSVGRNLVERSTSAFEDIQDMLAS